MKGIKALICAALLASAVIPGEAAAIGIEAAVGVWSQEPQGNLSFKGDNLNLGDNLRYSEETRLSGRVKIDMPLLIPNIYLMATPMEFAGTGQKDVSFVFGDQTFAANTPFSSKLRLDHYDVGLFYSLPFLKTATLDLLNVELGINARMVDLKATMSQSSPVPGIAFQESESAFLVVPMLYAGVQLEPVKWFSAEAEFRGIVYSGNYYYDVIGRGKIKPFGPLFIAGGYRYEHVKIDDDDLNVRAELMGPFGEVGVEF